MISTGSKRDATIMLRNPLKCARAERGHVDIGLSRHKRIFGAKIPSFPLGEPLAQTVEHRPFKARALGSSPRRLTTFFNSFCVSSSVAFSSVTVLVTVPN